MIGIHLKEKDLGQIEIVEDVVMTSVACNLPQFLAANPTQSIDKRSNVLLTETLVPLDELQFKGVAKLDGLGESVGLMEYEPAGLDEFAEVSQ